MRVSRPFTGGVFRGVAALPLAMLALAACGEGDSGSGGGGPAGGANPAAITSFAKRCHDQTVANLRVGQRGFDADLQARMRAATRTFCACFSGRITGSKDLSAADKAAILGRARLTILPPPGLGKPAAETFKAHLNACHRPFSRAVFDAAKEHMKRKKAKESK